MFKVAGWAEGLSFLILLFVAMPLKYYWGMPESVRIVGMLHGILFLIYVAIAVLEGQKNQWPKRIYFYALLSAILPFGPFYFDWFIRQRHDLQSSRGCQI